MGKDTVAIDIDGTLADIVHPWLLIMERDFGIKAMKEDLTRYDFWEIFNIPKEDSYRIFVEMWNHPESIMVEDRDIPSIIDNISSMYRVRILTATVGKDNDVKGWLKANRIIFDEYMHVEHSNLKHTLDDVAIYVDDSPNEVKEIANAGKKAILLRQPWNAGFDTSPYKGRISVAENWRQIEDMLINKEYAQPKA